MSKNPAKYCKIDLVSIQFKSQLYIVHYTSDKLMSRKASTVHVQCFVLDILYFSGNGDIIDWFFQIPAIVNWFNIQYMRYISDPIWMLQYKASFNCKKCWKLKKVLKLHSEAVLKSSKWVAPKVGNILEIFGI